MAVAGVMRLAADNDLILPEVSVKEERKQLEKVLACTLSEIGRDRLTKVKKNRMMLIMPRAKAALSIAQVLFTLTPHLLAPSRP